MIRKGDNWPFVMFALAVLLLLAAVDDYDMRKQLQAARTTTTNAMEDYGSCVHDRLLLQEQLDGTCITMTVPSNCNKGGK